MYLKLSIRNAKRSAVDYLLYLTTMIILLSLMELSHCMAIAGNVQAGFQTASLPALITMILVIVTDYIDTFMLRQRAKEFANYSLLGMEKNRLARMFLCEIFLLGVVCFAAGAAIGVSLYALFDRTVLQTKSGMNWTLVRRSLRQTGFYFCVVQGVCAFGMKRHMSRLQIRELMHEKERNRAVESGESLRKSRIAFLAYFTCLISLVCGIAFLPQKIAFPMISVVAIPLVASVFYFYKALFGFLQQKRQQQSNVFFHKNRIYMVTQITKDKKTFVILNGIFCLCLLFSAMSFVFGVLMLQPDIRLFDDRSRLWMAFLQISLCIIFVVLYFSLLSLKQMIELRNEAKGLRILYYMGEGRRQTAGIVKKQIALRLLMPMWMAGIVLLSTVPFLHSKLDSILSCAVPHIFLKAVCGYLLCFLLFYCCYFIVVYTISWRYIRIVSCK